MRNKVIPLFSFFFSFSFSSSLIFCLFFLLLSPKALAGVLIEPYAGYKLNLAADTTYVADGVPFTVKTDIDPAPEFGGRVALALWGFWAALDYSQSEFELQDSYILPLTGSEVTRHKTDFEEKKLALALGGSLPLLRFWGKYYWDVQWKYKHTYLTGLNPTGDYREEMSGKGYGAGIAYRMLPYVNFFVEYSHLEIDEIEKSTSNGIDHRTAFPQKTKREIDSIMAGLSFPLDLF